MPKSFCNCLLTALILLPITFGLTQDKKLAFQALPHAVGLLVAANNKVILLAELSIVDVKPLDIPFAALSDSLIWSCPALVNFNVGSFLILL